MASSVCLFGNFCRTSLGVDCRQPVIVDCDEVEHLLEENG